MQILRQTINAGRIIYAIYKRWASYRINQVLLNAKGLIQRSPALTPRAPIALAMAGSTLDVRKVPLPRGEAEWKEIASADLGNWNHLLTQTDARVQQYPFYNERYKSRLVFPRYLYCAGADAPVAYACVLTLGLWRLKVGLIANGPTSLTPGADVSLEAMRGFAAWARAHGYLFVRVTHPDAAFLDALRNLGCVEEGDPFSTFLAPESELLVKLVEDHAALLAGFQEVARRLIKQADRAGYRVETSEAPESLADLWPFFQAHAQRKGLKYRPLESYMEMMRFAQPDRCARLYVASVDDKPVNAILILRDRNVAHFQLGALDVDALAGKPSPSCLLHFRAMRDFRAMGATSYNLGIRGGPVYTFKKKFRPMEIFYPAPCVIIARRTLYRLWNIVITRYARGFMSLIRAILR